MVARPASTYRAARRNAARIRRRLFRKQQIERGGSRPVATISAFMQHLTPKGT